MKKLTFALILLTLIAPAQLMAKSHDNDLVDGIIKLHLAPFEILHQTIKKTGEINHATQRALTPSVTVRFDERGKHPDRYHQYYNDRQYDRRTVRNIQLQLRSLGFYHYDIDGIIGFRTRKAVREYQRYHHMDITGRLSPILIDHIFRPLPKHKQYNKHNKVYHRAPSHHPVKHPHMR